MATLLPNGKQQFIDANGNPLVGGTVTFYVPGTTTAKDTYQDAAAGVLNANPLTLDSRGQAIIYGVGAYRQIVKDSLGNTVWDQVTTQPAAATDVQAGTYLLATSVAGTDTIAGTLSPAPSAYTNGMKVRWLAVGPNVGAVTVNWSAIGAVALVKPGASGPTAFTGGEMQTSQVVEAVYDLANTRFVMTTPLAGSGTVTSLADATNGGVTVTNTAGAVTLKQNVADLTAATPTQASTLAFEAGAGTKRATLAGAASSLVNIAAATKAQMQTGTDNTTVATPARVGDHDGAAKAWCAISALGANTSASFGVSSAGKTGTGAYTVTLTTAMATANYIAVATPQLSAGNSGTAVVVGKSTTVVTVNTFNGAGTQADIAFDLIVMGRQ